MQVEALPPGADRVRPLLHNLRRLVVVTTHGSPKRVNVVEGEPAKHLVGRQLRALCHPLARTRSLALYGMDTAGETMHGLPMEAINALAEVGRTAGMGAAAEVMVAFAAELGQGFDEETKAREQVKFGKLDIEAVAAFGAELNSYPPMLDELSRLNVPTTVLVGENDTGLRAAADKLAATIPGATLVVIPGTGHSPQADDPAAWLAAVEGHLARAAL